MTRSNAGRLVTFGVLTLSCSRRPPAPDSTEPVVPPAIQKAAETAVQVSQGPNSGCSGVVVSPKHVLSAAHCARGYDGKETPGAFHLERAGHRHDLTLIDVGDFHPDDGKMGDWMVLEATDIPSNAPVASFATSAEIESAHRVGDSLADRSVAVWTVTFPARGARIHPRPPPGRPWPFLSPGFVKSDLAYRETCLLALLDGVVYDDSNSARPPRLGVDLDAAWSKQTQQTLFQLHQKYRGDGDPIL